MTTTLDIDPVKEAELIAGQNDAFRRSILGTTSVADEIGRASCRERV